MATPGTTEFAAAAAQVAALAGVVADAVRGAVAARGRASLVATGGSTPGPLYDALAVRRLPWSEVWITLSDERWVPPDHPDSNERLVRERLLHGPAAAARLVPLKIDAPTPQDAVERVEAAVAAMPRPFDLVLLGMGEDGHIASLFPGEVYDPAAAGLVRAARSPAGIPRLSLSLKALADARMIAFMIRGEAKRRIWRDAAAGRAPHLPVADLLATAQCPVEAFWAP